MLALVDLRGFHCLHVEQCRGIGEHALNDDLYALRSAVGLPHPDR
ncbi:hypothetical protein ACIP5Y_25790 [Nocardia sp. NPDC088792]